MADQRRNTAEAPPEANVDLGKVPLLEPEDGAFRAFSNVAQLNWTLTDVKIRFCELTQESDDERPTWDNQHGILLEHAAVTMPWYTAKLLCLNLVSLLKNYEELNGELKRPRLPARPNVDELLNPPLAK
ncbi:hypothetical protein SBA3_3650006 [Candidatus Sulfopaludibacter sp. SbA3]|nr:hypothetical protein SBA3_3650006 [Candidatus Sulfopaludibacter sp. SbA3]